MHLLLRLWVLFACLRDLYFNLNPRISEDKFLSWHSGVPTGMFGTFGVLKNHDQFSGSLEDLRVAHPVATTNLGIQTFFKSFSILSSFRL